MDRVILGENAQGTGTGFWVSRPGVNALAMTEPTDRTPFDNWYGYQVEFDWDGSPEPAWSAAGLNDSESGVYLASGGGSWAGGNQFDHLIRSANGTLLVAGWRGTSTIAHGSILFTKQLTEGATYPPGGNWRGAPTSEAFSGSVYRTIEMKIRLVPPLEIDGSANPDLPIGHGSDFNLWFENRPIENAGVSSGSQWNTFMYRGHADEYTGTETFSTGDTVDRRYLSANNLYFNGDRNLSLGSWRNIFKDEPEIGSSANDWKILEWDMTTMAFGPESPGHINNPATNQPYSESEPFGRPRIPARGVFNPWISPQGYMFGWEWLYFIDHPGTYLFDNDNNVTTDPVATSLATSSPHNLHPLNSEYRITQLRIDLNARGYTGNVTHDDAPPMWEIDYIRVKKTDIPKDAGKYGNIRDALIFSTDWYSTGVVHQTGTVTIGTQKANIDGSTSSNLFSDTVKETDTGIINFPRLPYIPLVIFQRYDPSGNTAYPGGEQEFSIGSTEWEDHTYPSTNIGGRNISQVGYDMQLVDDYYVGAEFYSPYGRTSDWTHVPWESGSTSWNFIPISYDKANLLRYGNYYTTESLTNSETGRNEGYGGLSFGSNMLPQAGRPDDPYSPVYGTRPPYIPDADPWNYGGPDEGSGPSGPWMGSPPASDYAYNGEVGKTISTEVLPWKTDIPSHPGFDYGYYQSHRAGNNFANQISTFYEARTFAYARAGKDHFALTCRNAIGNEGMEPVLNLAPTLPEEGTANQGSDAYDNMKFMNDNGNWGMFHPAFTLYDTHDGSGPVKFSEGLKLAANTTTSANDMFLDKVGEAGEYAPAAGYVSGWNFLASSTADTLRLPAQTYPQFKWNPSFSSHPLIFDGELARPTDDPPTLAMKDNTSSIGFPQFGMMDASNYLNEGGTNDDTLAGLGQEYKDNHGKYEGSTGGFYPYRYHREEKSIGGSLMMEQRAAQSGANKAFFWYEYDIKRLSSKGITHPYGAVPESNSAFTNMNGTRGATGQVKNQTAYMGGARNVKTATNAVTFDETDSHPPVYRYWVLRVPMSISAYTPNEED